MTLKLHKNILSKSYYFSSILNKGFSEAKILEDGKSIKIQCKNINYIKNILKFLYIGYDNSLFKYFSNEDLFDMILLSDYYGIKELTNILVENLGNDIENINEKLCLTIIKYNDLLEYDLFFKKILNNIVKKYNKISIMEEFIDLYKTDFNIYKLIIETFFEYHKIL